MARRAQGVRKDARTGRYQARFVDAHGRRKSKTFARQKDAVEWLRSQQANRLAEELGQQPVVVEPTNRPLFKKFAGDWFNKQKGEWAKATRVQAERIVKNLKASRLGTLTVDELDFRAVESFLDDLASKKKKSGKELVGYAEVRIHLVYLRRITKRMQVEYALPIWACETVRLSKDVRRRRGKKRPAFTPTELGAFLDALDHADFKETRWRGLFWILASTGMRPAEALALRRNRIDFEGGRIIVNASTYRGEVRETTKTGSAREPGMAAELAEVLTEHMKRFPTLPAGFLFPARTGGTRGGDTLRKPFKEVLKIAGITTEGLTPYSLRNTFNSIGETLFGASLALRDSLGHVGADMTALYNRTTAEERAEVASGILGVVRSARPPCTVQRVF